MSERLPGIISLATGRNIIFAVLLSTGAAAFAEANWGFASKILSSMRTPYEYFFSRPTWDQVQAGIVLDDPDAQKSDYRVTNHIDVLTSRGLAARNVPLAPPVKTFDRDLTLIRRLQPGDTIEGAIPWSGQDYDRPASTELKKVWLVWRRDDGVVEFIANNPTWIQKCDIPKCEDSLP